MLVGLALLYVLVRILLLLARMQRLNSLFHPLGGGDTACVFVYVDCSAHGDGLVVIQHVACPVLSGREVKFADSGFLGNAGYV